MTPPNAYRQRKNRELWATVGQLGRFLQRQNVVPATLYTQLAQTFPGKSLLQLTDTQKTHLYRHCAEAIMRTRARMLFQAEHISDLSARQLLRLTEELQAMMTGQTPQELPSQSPTENQLRKIQHMYQALGWNEQRQRGYNQRIISKEAPETKHEASNLIQAIQGLLRHYLK